ncbi:MAG: hypothetical protein S0880_14090 [Actinomycetota bacterium]|nr:hypothetical protein [Actinomycetota bacterium]
MADVPTPGRAAVRIVEGVAARMGPALQQLTASDAFADAVELGTAAQRQLARQVEARSRRLLHFWNLPAGSDIAVLRREIGELERQVRDLTKRLEDAGHAAETNGRSGR